jgi:hypothetical protein
LRGLVPKAPWRLIARARRLRRAVTGSLRAPSLNPWREMLLATNVDPRRSVLRCLIVAILLMAAAFPDVIFLGASLSTANMRQVMLGPAPHKVEIFPERQGRQAWHGYSDSAGALQSEPGALFMTRSLWNDQSVYWNPFSGTGSYGIETLVDVKTSPLSIVTALLGGSDAAFHVAYLGFATLGVFCLLLLFTTHFRVSLLAATMGGVSYLLNGYLVANQASNVSQTWLYFPLACLALVSFARSPRVTALLGIAAAATLIFATTFLPTMLTIAGVVVLVGFAAAAGFSFAEESNRRDAAFRTMRIACAQSFAILLALAVLAVVYVPDFEAMSYMGTGEFYGKRIFYPATLVNLISFFTPKHAFESYSATPVRALGLIGNVAFHQGIFAALVVVQTARAWPLFERILLGTMAGALIVLVARAYGLPGINQLFDLLPVVGHVGQQYLWIGIAALFTLILPYGFEALLRQGARVWPVVLCSFVIGAALIYTAVVYGFDDEFAVRYVAVAGLMLPLAALVILSFRDGRSAVWSGLLLLCCSWAELTFYVNHLRYSRTERFLEPPAFVQFLRSHAGFHRVASYGNYGIPPEWGSAYGIQQIGSMNFQVFPRYEDLFNRLIVPDPKDRVASFVTLLVARDTDAINLKAYDFVGTKYLLTSKSYPRLQAFMKQSGWKEPYRDPDFAIFENPDPLPRAFITHRLMQSKLTPIDDNQSPRAVATSDDAVLIEQAQRYGLVGAGQAVDAAGEGATITRYRNADLEIVADLSQPGILVLTDAWHPNWSASIDGVPTHLGTVDEAFRGVALPAGRHSVEMSYAPKTLPVARFVSALGIIALLLLWFAQERLNRVLAIGMGPRCGVRTIGSEHS